jgi:GntR family transcriptional regulator
MGSFVAESSELPTSLLRAEFTQHFDAMLACAARLGISRNDIRQLLAEQPDPGPDPDPAPVPDSEGPTP